MIFKKGGNLNKITIEIVKKFSEDNNFSCLSLEYKNAITKMDFKCPKNHIHNTTWQVFSRKPCCSICSKLKKKTIEEIKEHALLDGTQCISEYYNPKEKLTFCCPSHNNHHYRMLWGNFQNGHRCKKCSDIKNGTLKRNSINYIQKYLFLNEDTLLSTEYKNAHKKLDIKCSDNHIFHMSWNTYQRGHRCWTCFKNNNRGEKHPNWNADRTRPRRLWYLQFNLNNLSILNKDANYSLYLHTNEYNIDHIFPRVAFIDNNLDRIYDKKLIYEICNSIDNLRIIPKEENTSKGGKYNQDEFMNWFENKLICKLMKI